MIVKKCFIPTLCAVLAAATAGMALATESENLNMRVLPAPGKVAIDGKFDDWDLGSGIFACGDVENSRNVCAVWFHAMYDRDNLDVIDVCYGRRLNEGGMKDAKTQGAAQAFAEQDDHSGYVQEIAVPWKLLLRPGVDAKRPRRNNLCNFHL